MFPRHFYQTVTLDGEQYVKLIPAWPPIRFLVFLTVLGPVWYLGWMWLGCLVLRASFDWAYFIEPALVMTVAWLIRGAVKYQERLAVEVGWHEPVGRQTMPGLVVVVGSGAALGALAGYFVAQAPSIKAIDAPMITWVIVCGAAETIQSVRRIPGR